VVKSYWWPPIERESKMQAQAVENTPKVSMMKYKNNSSIEEEEKEIERLAQEIPKKLNKNQKI
jgi:hypothetical protein